MSLAPSEGLANFEKCIHRLERVLPAAISQQRRKNANQKPSAAASASARPDESLSSSTKEIDLVVALINLINSNYVDEGCNAPPTNLVRLSGITAAEALSGSYRQLVEDFKGLRDRWARAAMMPPSSRNSSPATSSRASSRASSGSTPVTSAAKGSFRPIGFLAGAPLSNRFSYAAARNNDDGDDDGPQQTRVPRRNVMVIPQEELPPSELYHPAPNSVAEYRAIGEQVRSVRELQDNLNNLVEGQQEQLDRTVDNTERAALHVENGRKNLYVALTNTTLASAVVGGIVGALIAGPAGMALGAQSGMAIASSVAAGGAVGAFTGSKIAGNAVEASGDAEWNRHTLPGADPQKVPPKPAAKK